MSHCVVVVVDELSDLVRKIRHRAEGTQSGHFRSKDPKPNLDLVEPRAMLGNKIEMNSMQWVTQEIFPRLHVFEYSMAFLLAECGLVYAALLGDEANAGLTTVRIEVV